MSSKTPNNPNRRRIAGERSKAAAPEPVAKPKARKTGKVTAPAKQPRPAPPKVAKTRRPLALKPPRSELRWYVPLAVLAVAAVVFAGVMVFRGVSHYQDEKSSPDATTSEGRSAAAGAAGTAAETIFSFNYAKLPQHLTSSQKLMTPGFAKSFEKIAPALTKLAPQRKVDVKATARDTAPLECGEDCSKTHLSVLVFLDQSRTTSDSTVPTLFGQRIELSMSKVGDRWLVSNITAL